MLGYYDFQEFDVVTGSEVSLVGVVDANGNPVIDPVTGNQETTTVVGADITGTAPAGHQWSVGLKGTYDAFGFGRDLRQHRG